jgi:hypothetical protein
VNESNPTIKEMVESALKAGGFGGLFCPRYECACTLHDLCPCDEPRLDCQAGYRLRCTCEQCLGGLGETPETRLCEEEEE